MDGVMVIGWIGAFMLILAYFFIHKNLEVGQGDIKPNVVGSLLFSDKHSHNKSISLFHYKHNMVSNRTVWYFPYSKTSQTA